MPELEIGAYRDAHLEMDRLLRLSGPIYEKAVQIAVKIHAPFFTQVGPDLRHRLTGETIEDWVKGRRTSNPNDYSDYAPDTLEQVRHEMIEDACMRPSPKHVGKLFTELGETAAKELLKQWGTDWVKMIPGQRPGYVDKETPKPVRDAANTTNNPWSPRFVGDNSAREARIASCFKVSVKFAQALATAAHTVLSKPLYK